jgi:hypothetical protein
MGARLTANPSKSQEVAEEVDFLLSQHQGVYYIAQTLRAKPSALARRMARAGRPDLARVFTTESTHPHEFPEVRNNRR